MANPKLIPYAPIWVKEYLIDELSKYDGFDVVIGVPASAMSIQDVLKNYKKYPDIVIQYDKLFMLRRTPFYPLKCEQTVIYLYGLPEKVYQAEAIIREALDRSDASAEDLNRWARSKQSSNNPIKSEDLILPHNVYFHDMKVSQLEEVRDLGELNSLRGIVVSKMLVQYDYHVINTSNNQYI